MDKPGNYLFAGTAFACDEYGGLRLSHEVHGRSDFTHGMAFSDQYRFCLLRVRVVEGHGAVSLVGLTVGSHDRFHQVSVGPFADHEIDEFVSLTDPTLFRAGEFVMRKGQPGDCMYYVAEGLCRAMDKRGEQIVELADFVPGRIFGELALFDQGPAAPTCRPSPTASS